MIEDFPLLSKDVISIFSGNANLPLARKIVEHLGLQLSNAEVKHFSDGEIWVEIEESVRGKDVYLIQPTCPDANQNIMELLIMLDAASRASADRITAVIPYYGYARQDRKVAPRAPISAKLVADLITTAGADRVLTVDLHAGQIQGFFNVPVDNLYATPVLMECLEQHPEFQSDYEIVVVSPDAGGVRRARYSAALLKKEPEMAVIDKKRKGPNVLDDQMTLIGQVKNKVAVIVDDIVDTAGTLIKAAAKLKEEGAIKVFASTTHAVLSGNALENIQNPVLDKLFITDTIPLKPKAKLMQKICQVTISKILAQAIYNIHRGISVSSLFKDVKEAN